MVNTYIQAHRGASAYAPENTLAAFKKALAMGAQGIELDVQLTKDDKLVVIHDYEISRVSNGKGRIMDMKLDELKEFDFGSWFSEEFKNEKIPTLEEVLVLLQGWDGVLNVEIKYTPTLSKAGLEEKTLELLQKYGMTKNTIVSSFNHLSLMQIKKLNPIIKTGVLYSCQMFEPWEYAKKLNAYAIHPSGYSVSADIIEACHREGIKVNIWTLNKQEDIRLAIDFKADSIITNVPDVALAIINQY